MTPGTWFDRLVQNDALNFFLTNRIPRRAATRVMGRLSRIEHPLFVRIALAAWQRLGGSLRLHEARKTRFTSIHDCFIRELADGVRPIDSDPDVLVSPCDAIVGTCGRIAGAQLIQAKGHTYSLAELLLDETLAAHHRDGVYVTLRLTSTMYHRFHAPADCAIDEVIYVAGDVWNVNPAAVRRVPRLYCVNERAVLPLRMIGGRRLTLVPVAAVLVASIHLNFLDVLLNLRYRGPNRIACRARFRKGDELGYFHHGSTVVVLGTGDCRLGDDITEGAIIRMGTPLLRCVRPVVGDECTPTLCGGHVINT